MSLVHTPPQPIRRWSKTLLDSTVRDLSGVSESYPDSAPNALLPYPVMAWFIFTFIMLVCTLRTTVAFVFLFLTLDLAFLFLALHVLLDMPVLQKAGGVFGACPTSCLRFTRCTDTSTRSPGRVYCLVLRTRQSPHQGKQLLLGACRPPPMGAPAEARLAN